jgi:hypothetical protein
VFVAKYPLYFPQGTAIFSEANKSSSSGLAGKPVTHLAPEIGI